MAKYIVDKSFRATEKDSKQRKLGAIVELSGKELKFAQDNKCVTKFVTPKK
tara:strand:- start:75 stop:227 length:153 start_codon:yes stop_codon:yes gene_type:complete